MKYTAITFTHNSGQSVIRVYEDRTAIIEFVSLSVDGKATVEIKKYPSYESAVKALRDMYGFVHRIY